VHEVITKEKDTPHLKCIDLLAYEILMLAFESLFTEHIVTHLMCGGIFKDHFI